MGRSLSDGFDNFRSQRKPNSSITILHYILVVIFSTLLIYSVSHKTMANLTIEKWDPAKDGTLSEQNLIKKLEKQGYNHIKYTFSPGTDFPDHTHAVSKKDAILTGQFQFGMYGQTVVLKPGDMVEVPKNTVHNARVVGSENVVFFDSTK